jgi:Na+-driven multidrug efflux pump
MWIIDSFFPSNMNVIIKYFLSLMIISLLLAILLWILMSIIQILQAKKKVIIQGAEYFPSKSDNKLNDN